MSKTLCWLQKHEECLNIKQDKTKTEQQNNQPNKIPPKTATIPPILPTPSNVSTFISFLVSFTWMCACLLVVGEGLTDFLSWRLSVLYAQIIGPEDLPVS